MFVFMVAINIFEYITVKHYNVTLREDLDRKISRKTCWHMSHWENHAPFRESRRIALNYAHMILLWRYERINSLKNVSVFPKQEFFRKQ